MGYSMNPELLAQPEYRELMAPLETGETCAWVVKGGWSDTKKVERKIRQGLYIASLYPSRWPKLASAASRFSIHIVAKGQIEARPKPTASTETTPISNLAVQHGLEPFGRDVPSVGMTRTKEIIDAWQAHMPSNEPLQFTKTVLSPEELFQLYTWGKTHKPKLMLLVGEHNSTLTVTLHDMSMEDYSWKPPQAAPPEETFNL